MNYQSTLLTGVCVAVLAFGGAVTASAQSKKGASPSPTATASPATKTTTATTEKAPRAIPFRGTASAVDQSAKTFTIAGKKESRTFKVTDKSTITKDGQSATLADLADNTSVTGSYWKQADGTLEVKTLKIGGAASGGTSSKKSDAAAGESPSPSSKK